jgi:hypothetical protein
MRQPCSQFTVFLTFEIQHSKPKKWVPNSLVGKIFWELWYILSPDETRDVRGNGKHSQKWRRCWTCPWPGTPTVVPVIWWGSILILAKVYAWEPSILQCNSWLECNKPYHWANHKSLQSLKFIVKHDLECKKTLHGNKTLYNQSKLNRTVFEKTYMHWACLERQLTLEFCTDRFR